MTATAAPTSGGVRETARQTREARRRQHVMTFIALAAAARVAVDKRTIAGVILVVIAVIAAKEMGGERGMPLLDWYRAAGGPGRDQAKPRGGSTR